MATPQRWDHICDVYSAVLRVAPGDREQLLSELCAGDAALVNEVRALIEHEHAARDFLNEPHPANALISFVPPNVPRLTPGDVRPPGSSSDGS